MKVTLAVTRDIRRVSSGILRVWHRGRTAVLIGLVVTLMAATIGAAALWAVNAARNRTISTLTHGHYRRVESDQSPRVIFAGAYFLMTHDRLEEAQAMMGRLDPRGDPRLRADLHYDMANTRLGLAFDEIRKGDIDAAGALVGLAREDYREAMRLDPGDWNARFNFDVASRLVREYPSFQSPPDARRQGPRPMWTDMPSTPQGEP